MIKSFNQIGHWVVVDELKFIMIKYNSFSSVIITFNFAWADRGGLTHAVSRNCD